MKQCYPENTIFIINLFFSKTTNFRNFFSLRNSVKKGIFAFLLLFFSFSGFAQTFGPNCPSLCYGPGGSFTSSGPKEISSDTFYSSITINNNDILTVKSGFTLYVGQVGTLPTTLVVDFQNGSTVLIEPGASLVVNGRLNNSNNSNSVTFNGSVSVTGDFTAGNGSTITGSGSFDSTGSVTGDGTIFGCSTDNYLLATISSTTATCSAAGTTTISNYIATNTYTFTPSGPTAGAGGLVSGMIVGTNYTVTSKQGSCTSASSRSFSNAAMLSTPSTPSASAQNFCSVDAKKVSDLVATGTAIKWYNAATAGTLYIGTEVLATGTYYASQTTNGCESARRTVSVIVNANVLASVSIAASSNPICSGTSLTFTATPTNGGGAPVYQWKLNGAIVGINSAAYTSSSLVNGDIVTCVMTSNASVCLTGSSATSNSITVTVNPILSIPTISTITQPDCITSTGSVTITNYNASYTYTVNPSSGASISGNTITAATGSYTITAALGSCSSVPSLPVNIIATVTNTWNGASWSLGSSPTSLNNKIVFADNYPPAIDPNVDIIGCSCLVFGGKNVIIKEGRTLKINNGLDVQGTGTLTFENKASLVQINELVKNTGNIIYKRKTTPIDKFDYTYWSSPVKDQTLLAVSPNTLQDKFYSFNPAINNWQQESPSGFMELGKGYIIRGPQEYTTQTATSTYEASFIGTPNNGIITAPVGIAASFNLIGNPYPSALDADSFLIYNKDFLNGTIYFWTHNIDIAINNPNPGSGVYAYSSNDYASYNLTGGVATKVAAISAVNSGAVNSNAASGKIASGQSFFTTSIAAGNVTFNNSMRVGVEGISGDNSQFFKFKSGQKTNAALEKNRVWLNLSNNQGVFKQTLVGYITGATNDYDSMFDGESVNGNDYVDFYSVYQDKKLVIQGRAIPFNQLDTIQLGYSANFAGSLVLDIDQLDGELKNQNIFIEDKEQHIIHNLTLNPYEFITAKGVYNDRFVLRYTDATFNNNTLGVNEIEAALENQLLVSNKNKQISIMSFAGAIDKVIIGDTTGKRIYNKTAVNSEELKISNLVFNQQQLLFVKVVLQDGKSIVKKIIY